MHVERDDLFLIKLMEGGVDGLCVRLHRTLDRRDRREQALDMYGGLRSIEVSAATGEQDNRSEHSPY
jgi:hypothetical protein